MADPIITAMIADAPEQVVQLTNSIASIDSQISLIQSQQDSLQNNVCSKVATDLELYLTTIKYDPDLDYTLSKGSTFNDSLSLTGTITDWNVIDSTGNIIYSYIPGDDSVIDGYKIQWDFGHDYITLPMSTSGTYGTLDNIAKLNTAKSLLTANKSKINNSITILDPFK
jgi:hypothetical protein